MMTASNAAAQPNYVFLMTEPHNMLLYLQALTGDSTKYAVAPLPSSTLFFEVIADKSGHFNIEAHFNDESLVLGGCSANSACSLNSFTEWLSSSIKISDVVNTCKATAH
jgi:homoserine acetyltransferase